MRAESGSTSSGAGGVKRLGAVRRIAGAWRGLCAGLGSEAGTVVACSGGADSVGVLIALSAAARPSERVVAGHVVHDMRSAEEAGGDRDYVLGLAGRLGVDIYERSVRIPAGNAEGGARGVRYAALAEIAREAGCGYVATGHHAEDQLETMIMAMIRGASVEGLRGIAPERELEGGVVLIRPGLHVRRTELLGICDAAGVTWREDATNSDTTRTRSGLRHGVIGALVREHTDAPEHAARCAEHLRDAAGVIRDRCGEVFGDALDWERDRLRDERGIVVGAGIRAAAARVSGGAGMDRLTASAIDPVIAAVRDGSGEERVFGLACGVRVVVGRERVRVDAGA